MLGLHPHLFEMTPLPFHVTCILPTYRPHTDPNYIHIHRSYLHTPTHKDPAYIHTQRPNLKYTHTKTLPKYTHTDRTYIHTYRPYLHIHTQRDPNTHTQTSIAPPTLFLQHGLWVYTDREYIDGYLKLRK